MSRDTSSQARIALAKKLWQLAHTDSGKLEEEVSDLSEETLDLDDEDGVREPENALAWAKSALATLSNEWVQNEFGSEVTDVIFDALNEYIEHVQQRDLKTVTVIRKDGTAILCEGGHLKVASWKLTGPSGRKWKTPHLYPWANWQGVEPAARVWLHRLGITLEEGEWVICPPDLTLQDMMG